jgi:membrane protease YdiL (CAAX protease family)
MSNGSEFLRLGTLHVRLHVRAAVVSILQVLGFFAAVIAAMAVLAIPTRALLGDSESVETRLSIAVLGLHVIAGIAITSWIMKRFGRSRLVLAGWPKIGTSLRSFSAGTLLGVAATGCSLLLVWIFGGGHLVFDSTRIGSYFYYIIPLVGALLLAALGEEWLFRGYPLTKIGTMYGHGWAIALTSLLFTVTHWGGEGWGLIAILNLMLFAVILGLLRCGQGGIAAAWGFHFGWNVLLALTGATLTAQEFDIPMVRFAKEGPTWASGGAFGPEASVGTTLATAGFLILMVYRYRHEKRPHGVSESEN